MKPISLEGEIEKVLKTLDSMEKDDPAYLQVAKNLRELYEIKSKLDKPRVSPDVLASVGGQLIITLVILHYEKLGVISSKAFNFIGRRFI